MSITPQIRTMRTDEMVVTVAGPAENGIVLVRDAYGVEIEVVATNRPKGSGEPRPDERWIITRRLGLWFFTAMVDVPQTPVIIGDREGLHPVIVQVLDALSTKGLVVDLTAPAESNVLEEEVSLDATNDPHVSDPTDPDFEDPDEADTSDPISRNPEPENPEDDKESHDPRFVNLRVATYNLFSEVGPRRSRIDILRLMDVADVIGLQECATVERGQVLDTLVLDSPWNLHRPNSAKEPPILWNSDVFEHVDDGWELLSESDGPGSARPRRTVTWVRLRHRKTNTLMTFVNTHMENAAAFAGFFDPDNKPTSPRHIERYKEQMAGLKPLLRDHAAKSSVFLTADFNVDFRDDLRKRNPGLPYVSFRSLGFRSNWDVLGFLDRQGTLMNRPTVFDGVFLHSKMEGLIRAVRHRILRGYSDHNAVVVTYRVRARR